MEKNKTLVYAEYIMSGLFYTGILIFFGFFYNSHLHFEEQFQLFLFTGDYFIENLGYPGGFAGYTGSFLTQFYYLSFAGPLIIAGLLFAIQRLTKHILGKVNPDPVLFPLSFVPALMAGMALCNEFYPLSAITGFLLAMLAMSVYVRITGTTGRFLAGIAIIPLTYWLAGGSFMSLLVLMTIYEILIRARSGKRVHGNSDLSGLGPLKFWQPIVWFVVAAGAPLLVRKYLIMQPVMMAFMSEFYYNIRTSIPTAILVLFILPPVLMVISAIIRYRERYSGILILGQSGLFLLMTFFGFRAFANFKAEQIMTYDYLVREGRWNDVVAFAERKPPQNYLSLAMLNLSLAKTGELGNRMFNYSQHGINGLFLPFAREFVAPIMGNEIFYNLGLTNASQEYAFESMETTPAMTKSARVIKRLAETNLINGQYAVSGKYLKLLEKTIFYRKWAKNAETYLFNEEKINADPDWGEKRKFMIRNDYFFHVKNMEAVLNRMIKEHPDNKVAFEYLMAFYLINKDLRNFMNLIPVMEKMNYREVPVSYQEAILYIIGLKTDDPAAVAPDYISPSARSRMKAYADIYTGYPDAEARLRKKFSGSYWYYLHFVEPEKSQEEEKN